ncbi:unnamed protein product [Chrysodeixis includens]|uniref:Citrate transporter-like domain-containing protein n=1 Tax=Chrysodeixis includens TaxID=689277 RepID=A0A9N8Q1S8_CHRIL|nr:unnamed protein product [Chrysodeixis includens]
MMIVFWTLDVLHPSVLAIIPIGLSCIMDGFGKSFISEMYIRNDLLDCFGVLMIVIAIENCNVHKRLALKVLLVFGCSHFRLSFLLFFTSTFISMWISNTLACGLMMPIVKAILLELEKLGILEMYQTIGKAKQISTRHEQRIFPAAPKIEFPHFMLLNLPGVLVMETLLYLWMNFNFLGMFRNRSTIEVAMTEEESQYMNTLLATQYHQMGKLKFHEFAVASVAILACLLQATLSTAHIDHAVPSNTDFHNHFRVSSPCITCVVILFLMPTHLDFMKYFKKKSGQDPVQNENNEPLPTTQSKSCLNWDMVRQEIHWSVLLIIAGSSTLFESLKDSGMHAEFEAFLLMFKGWPPFALVFVIVVFCKILTEFASNFCIVYGLLPNIARVSVMCGTNPHYLMMAATLASSLPFHLVTGASVNAMVCAYVHIPPWRMMYAGLGPSLISIIVVWLTVAVWSTAIWTDITLDPDWSDVNVFQIFRKG